MTPSEELLGPLENEKKNRVFLTYLKLNIKTCLTPKKQHVFLQSLLPSGPSISATSVPKLRQWPRRVGSARATPQVPRSSRSGFGRKKRQQSGGNSWQKPTGPFRSPQKMPDFLGSNPFFLKKNRNRNIF